MNKKLFEPKDMKNIQHLSGVTVTNDGKLSAYVLSKGDEKTGLFLSQIYLMNLENGEINPILGKPKANYTQPRFSNENKLFYLSDESGENQLYCMNLKTDVVTCLTTARHGINRYSLSVDGKKAVVELDLWKEDIEKQNMFKTMNEEEKKAWKEELEYKPYEITDLTYKMDEWYGMRYGELPRIAVVDVTTGIQTLVVNDELESVYPALSNDGSKVIFYGYPYKGAKGRQAELFICNSDGNERRQLTHNNGVYVDNYPAFTNKGDEVIFVGVPNLSDGSTVLLPYAINIENGRIRNIIGDEEDDICHGINTFAGNRTEWGNKLSYFYEHEKFIYFISSFKGRENIYKKNLYAIEEPIEIVEKGNTAIHEFAMGDNGSIIFLMANLTRPVELYLKNNEKETKCLTNVNSWIDEYDSFKTEEFWVKSKDGKADIQVWLAHPAKQEDDRLYPAVLYVRGGPEVTYNADYWHEFHALTSAGIAVIYANPRGSLGYGREFCANGIAWAKEAMDDLVVAVESSIEKGFIDKKRIGITGGSYGGYMTNKFIGRTNYFAAAVSQRCLINPLTSYGTGDMGFISSNPNAKGVKMFDYLEDRTRENAITYIDNMKIPLLLLHGYKDYRCSFEQAEQLFIAMKDRNPEVPVRMVVFPEENHGITRVGKLYNQIKHLQELRDWFIKYLV